LFSALAQLLARRRSLQKEILLNVHIMVHCWEELQFCLNNDYDYDQELVLLSYKEYDEVLKKDKRLQLKII
jgi:hypothetical protein